MSKSYWKEVMPAFLILAGIAIVMMMVNLRIRPDSPIFTAVLAILFGGVLLVVMAKRKPTFSTYGTAGWASMDDISELLADANKPPEVGGFILGQPIEIKSKRLEIPLQLGLKHILVLGPSGSGKSRCFFLHQFRHYRGSFITTDPKGEAWKLTSGKRKRPLRFAPREPDNSEPFNWIPLCGSDPTLCTQLANAIITSKSEGDNKFYIEAGTAFLASLFAHASSFDTPTPAAVFDFLTTVEGEALTRLLLNSPNEYARKFAMNFTKAEPKLQGNIIIGAGNLLNWLADEKVRRFTSSTTKAPNFGKLRESQISVYWCLAENDVEILKPLSTLFFTLALHQIKAEGKGDLPITFFLDEFANIGKIPALDVEITILRGRNISLVLGLQSVAQVENLYGRTAAKVILDNCGTTIILAGLKHESAKYVSDSLGNSTIVEERVSQSKRGGFFGPVTETKTLERVQRPLATPDEVRRMRKTEQIVISDNYRPILSKRFWYKAPASTAQSLKLGRSLTKDFSFSDLDKPATTNPETSNVKEFKMPNGLKKKNPAA